MNSDEIINSLFYFELFERIWSYGLVIFGTHLLILSVTCFKSKFTPKFIAVLISFGGISYIFIESSKSFFPQFGVVAPAIESVLIVPMALSELVFAVWLIIKSFRLKKGERI